MKTGFKDPIATTIKKKEERTPWNYDAPQYDQRTAGYTSTGTDYGVGHRQPVGREGNPKSRAGTLPFGRVDTLSLKVNSREAEIQED